MKQVKCKSGLTGWQCRLQKNYTSFEEFKAYSETYGIHQRLGFKSAEEAWDKNPTIQGSTEPSDLCVVMVTYSRKPTTSEIKFGHGATHYRDFPLDDCVKGKKNGITILKKRLKADDGLIYTR
jgi:hypothetical protein